MTIADQARNAAIHCEAKKHAYRQTQDGVVVSFVLHPQEVPEGLATAPLGARYLIALVELSDDETPKQPAKENRVAPHPETLPSPQPDGAKRERMDWRNVQPAAQAGIRANDPVFLAFMEEEHPNSCINGLDCAAYIRNFCEVNSRAELSTNHTKRVLWHQLDSQFQAWKAKERVGA